MCFVALIHDDPGQRAGAHAAAVADVLWAAIAGHGAAQTLGYRGTGHLVGAVPAAALGQERGGVLPQESLDVGLR